MTNGGSGARMNPKEAQKRQSGGKEIQNGAPTIRAIVVEATGLKVPLVVPVGEARRNLRLPEKIHRE